MCHLNDDIMDARDEAKLEREAHERGEFCKTCNNFDETIPQIKLRFSNSGFCFSSQRTSNRDSWCKQWIKKEDGISEN